MVRLHAIAAPVVAVVCGCLPPPRHRASMCSPLCGIDATRGAAVPHPPARPRLSRGLVASFARVVVRAARHAFAATRRCLPSLLLMATSGACVVGLARCAVLCGAHTPAVRRWLRAVFFDLRFVVSRCCVVRPARPRTHARPWQQRCCVRRLRACGARGACERRDAVAVATMTMTMTMKVVVASRATARRTSVRVAVSSAADTPCSMCGAAAMWCVEPRVPSCVWRCVPIDVSCGAAAVDVDSAAHGVLEGRCTNSACVGAIVWCAACCHRRLRRRRHRLGPAVAAPRVPRHGTSPAPLRSVLSHHLVFVCHSVVLSSSLCVAACLVVVRSACAVVVCLCLLC
jgi:hypothetical protein